MALVECKECGGQMSNTVKFCPHCGAIWEVAVGYPESQKPLPMATVFVGLFVILAGAVMGIFPIMWFGFFVILIGFYSAARKHLAEHGRGQSGNDED